MKKRNNTRTIVIIIIIIILGIAYFTKPDNKTIIIKSVARMWGRKAPSPQESIRYYEDFMNLNSKSIRITDWLFFKTINFRMGTYNSTIGFAAFSHVYFTNRMVLYK